MSARTAISDPKPAIEVEGTLGVGAIADLWPRAGLPAHR